MKSWNSISALINLYFIVYREAKRETEIQNLKQSSDSEDVLIEEFTEESIFDGNIKVTIKDKPVVESKEEILQILKKSFEALKLNAQEARRLRELKTKIQEKMSKRIIKR